MNETTEYLRPDQPSQCVSESLAAWLARPEWELAEAYDWLQGCYLPPVGYDDEPFEWMCRGLLLSPERPEAEVELARRMAQVLAQRPDVTRPGTRPDQLLYNLFMLCAGLHRPAELGAQLYEIFARRKLRGEWLDVDLRAVLTTALIANQADQRLLPVWQVMLAGQGDDFLIGDETDGLDGVTLMPAADTEPDEPALDEIGKALKMMAQHLSQDPDRRAEFKAYISRVVETYPGRPTWNVDLIRLADKNHWPEWGVECLPSLCIQLNEAADGRANYLIWHFILACVPKSYQYKVVSSLCSNHIYQAYLTKETEFFIKFTTPVIEQRRLNNPFPSERSMHGVVTDAMAELELIARGLFDTEAVEEFKEARREITKRTLEMPNLHALSKALYKLTSTHESDQDRESMISSLAKPVTALYPSVNLKEVAEEQHFPSWAINSLGQAARLGSF